MEKQGDLPGWGTDIGSALHLTRQECAEKCDGEKICMSFEHSDTEMKCNLNKIAEPSQGPFRDYVFCTKIGRFIDLVNVSMDIYLYVCVFIFKHIYIISTDT